jgi:predicted ATPase
MSSWRSLHLEQSSLRTPDGYGDPSTVDELGRHIASTLHRLHRESGKSGEIYAEAATRLSALVPDVQEVRVHDDAVHEQRVVEVKMRGAGQWFRPRSLSDGTLRFLALITMELDGESSRALCMEEPENGISFHSIPRLIELLRDYAVDPSLEVDDDNPTRQVILNSHSPEVLKHLDATEVLFIDSLRTEAGPEALVRPVQCRGNWRRDARPVTFSYLREAMRGSPIGDPLTRQMVMEQEPSA